MSTYILITNQRRIGAVVGQPITALAAGEHVVRFFRVPGEPESDADRAWLRDFVLPLMDTTRGHTL